MRMRKKTPASGWRQWKPDEAKSALAALRESGLPLATFARQQGYSAQRLRWWKGRLGDRGGSAEQTAGLVPAIVTGLATVAASEAVVTVRAPGEVVVEIADVVAVPASWVAELVKGLSRPTR